MSSTHASFTMSQAYRLLLLALFSPAVHLASKQLSQTAGHAGWISICIASALLFGLIAMLHALVQQSQPHTNLMDIYNSVLGKFVGTVICVIQVIWLFVLAALYLRLFAERFVASIFPGIPLSLFMVVLLALCYVILNGSTTHWSNMVSICFFIALADYLVVILLSLPKINIANIYPVTTLDTGSIIEGLYPLLGTFCYITYLLFMGDDIIGLQDLRRAGRRYTPLLLAVHLLIFLSTVGVFGSQLTESFTLPFFMSIKTINLFGALEHMEALFILFWVVTDIAVIILLLRLVIKILHKLTSVKQPTLFVTPLLFGLFVFALFFAGNIFELHDFANSIALAINLGLGVLIPGLVYLIAALRKRIQPSNRLDKRKSTI